MVWVDSEDGADDPSALTLVSEDGVGTEESVSEAGEEVWLTPGNYFSQQL